MFFENNILSYIKELEFIEYRTVPRLKEIRIEKTVSNRSQMSTLYSVYKRYITINGMVFYSASTNIHQVPTGMFNDECVKQCL